MIDKENFQKQDTNGEQLNKIKPGLILKPWLHLETSVLMGTLKLFSE